MAVLFVSMVSIRGVVYHPRLFYIVLRSAYETDSILQLILVLSLGMKTCPMSVLFKSGDLCLTSLFLFFFNRTRDAQLCTGGCLCPRLGAWISTITGIFISGVPTLVHLGCSPDFIKFAFY